MIKFQNVNKQYGDKCVVKDCNLSIHSGEFFVLVGPSGSGKTTTLKMINRLIEPTEGDILYHHQRLKDYDLRELRLSIGYVLQQIALFPNMSVAENIELIPEMKHWSKTTRRQRTRALLQQVNLDPDIYLHRNASELSGGEQQRIGILRAIAAKPDLILMDEPFSALDPISRHQLQLLMKSLHQELESTFVFVTHDMNEAMLLGDRICIMREGQVVQIDTPDNIQSHPADDFVAQFFSQQENGLSKYLLSDLLDLGYLEHTKHISSASQLPIHTPLTEAISMLANDSPLNITNNQGEILGHLTEKRLLQFLADKVVKEGVTA